MTEPKKCKRHDCGNELLGREEWCSLYCTTLVEGRTQVFKEDLELLENIITDMEKSNECYRLGTNDLIWTIFDRFKKERVKG